MLGLLWIVLCLVVGEGIAAWTRLPVPGSVLGMALMLAGLCCIGRVPECIAAAAGQLIRLLPLFVIPAGVSVMANIGMLRADLPAIAVAVVLSTLAALGLTGWLASRTASCRTRPRINLRKGARGALRSAKDLT
jgi:holin-like protein